MTLKCCNLTPSCSFDGLVSLKSLALLSLKRLTMDRDCKLNIDLSKLKYLAIVDCERLRGININGAVELNKFFFGGKHEYCSFKNVPKLANVSFNCNTDDDYDGVLDVLTKFGHRLPQLEILNLHGRTPYVSECVHKYYIYSTIQQNITNFIEQLIAHICMNSVQYCTLFMQNIYIISYTFI